MISDVRIYSTFESPFVQAENFHCSPQDTVCGWISTVWSVSRPQVKRKQFLFALPGGRGFCFVVGLGDLMTFQMKLATNSNTLLYFSGDLRNDIYIHTVTTGHASAWLSKTLRKIVRIVMCVIAPECKLYGATVPCGSRLVMRWPAISGDPASGMYVWNLLDACAKRC